MDLTLILEATLSPDTQQVMQSQKQLEYAAENNLVSDADGKGTVLVGRVFACSGH